MLSFPSSGSATVIAFRPRPASWAGLTTCDRIEILQWRERARLAGFDRLVVHEHSAGDPPELGSMLTIHRTGEAGSAFAVTRSGGRVVAWCTCRHRDLGTFDSIGAALRALMAPRGMPGIDITISPPGQVVPFATVA